MSWDWLSELGRRLAVELQVVDGGGAPVRIPALDPPLATGASAPRIFAPDLKAAVLEAIGQRTPQGVVADERQYVCIPLTAGGTTHGALVLARPLGARTGGGRALRSELEVMGRWLGHAAEAHLAAVPVRGQDLDLAVALGHVLTEAGQSGHDHDLLFAFVQALAIWHDIEACSYVESAAGTYVLEVVLPGATGCPRTMTPPAGFGAVGLPMRISKADAEQLGFTGNGEMVVSGPNPLDGTRIMVFRGRSMSGEITRLSVYLTLVEEWMRRARAERALRALSAIADHCRADDLQAEDVSRRVLAELVYALGASASLEIAGPSGAPVVSAGEGTAKDGTPLVVARSAAQHTVRLSVWPPSPGPFPAHDRRLIDTVASLLESWLRGRHPARAERRTSLQTSEDVIDRLASQALRSGEDVTAVVLRIDTGKLEPGAASRWVAQLRAGMRASDTAATLGEGEIGLLVRHIPRERVHAVISRLLRECTGDDTTSDALLSVGRVSQSWRDMIPDGIMSAARAGAGSPKGEGTANAGGQ